MDLDDEIEPTVTKMKAIMERLQKEYLPLLEQLDEDTVVAHYEVGAQARIYLAAAFTLSMSLFSLDKLLHESHQHHPRVESSDNLVMACGGSPCDARLLLQIQRILDFIKKFREIAHRSMASPSVESEPASEVKPLRRKRSREESGSDPSTGRCDVFVEDDMGDAAMFQLVAKPELKVGKIVGNLMNRMK